MSRPIEERASQWLYDEIVTTENCLERMEALGEAPLPHQQDERSRIIRGYRNELEIWRYLRSLIPDGAA